MKQPEPVTVRQATSGDLTYVVSLMRANRESVGGLPVPALGERIERQTLLLASINDDPAGYLLYDLRDGVLRIPQACIQYDARRRHHGEALVSDLLRRCASKVHEIRVRCAADLEANVFWRDMGFTCIGSAMGGKRRSRTINLWVLWLEPRLFEADAIGRAPVAEIRQDCKYDDTDYLETLPDGFAGGAVLPPLAWANRKKEAA